MDNGWKWSYTFRVEKYLVLQEHTREQLKNRVQVQDLEEISEEVIQEWKFVKLRTRAGDVFAKAREPDTASRRR